MCIRDRGAPSRIYVWHSVVQNVVQTGGGLSLNDGMRPFPSASASPADPKAEDSARGLPVPVVRVADALRGPVCRGVVFGLRAVVAVSYTHLRAHETDSY